MGKEKAVLYETAGLTAREYYSTIKTDGAILESVNLLTERDELREFYSLPTSPVVDIIMKVMGTSDLATLPARNKVVSHGQTIEVLKSKHEDSKRRIKVKSGVSNVTLEVEDINKLAGSNKSVKKMFTFLLFKINDQAFSGGTLRRKYVHFPLQELINIGFYSRPQSAKIGFKNAMDTLMSLKVMGTLKKGKKNIEQNDIAEIFKDSYIKNGTCTVYLNGINWNFVSAFYTILPKYYFKLPNKASDLLYYIFYIARQRVKKIEEQGYFTVSMRAVQERLNLPSEVVNRKPSRDIKKPIEDAITAIEEANQSRDFTITPYYDMDSNIVDFLDNGYLKIELKGRYAKGFIALSKKSTKQIQSSKKNGK